MKKLLLFAIVVLGFTAVSFGQAPTEGAFMTINGTASATIIKPLTLTAGSDLAFGNIAVHADDEGTVTIAPDATGTISNDGGTTIPVIAGTHSSASFDLTGEASSAITITLPADGDVTISNGTQTMIVNNFTKSTITAIGADGTATFYVGATLEVEAGQEIGDYEGEFDVTVIYN